jgi:hypothetical protein
MALFKTVVRKYTPPTCTLEVRGKESLLSRWAGRTILQDLKFKLSFDDPRQPDEKQVSIWGDRMGLEALSTAVSDYVQNFLQSRDGDLAVNGREPITDSLPRTKTNSRAAIDLPDTQTEATPARGSDTAATKVIPISPIFQRQTLNPYLKPKGLVNHELCLGALQTPESGPSIDLSALQLFDLATALDTYGAEMLDMPVLGQKRPSIPLWGYAAGAAAVIVAGLGLAPAAMRLANTSGGNNTVVAVSDSPDASTSTTPLPNSEVAAIPSPLASPTPFSSPTGSVPPGQGLPFGVAPPGVTSTPGNGPINPGSGVPNNTPLNPGSGIPNNIPSVPNGLGNAGQPVPGINNGSTQPPITSNKVAVGNGRSLPQYGLDSSGVRLGNSEFKTSNNLGKSPSTSRGKSRNSPPDRVLTIFGNPSQSSSTRTNPKNQPSSKRRAIANKNQRNSVPAFNSGEIQTYVDPGDNPANFGLPSQEESSSSNPKRSRVTRSSKNRQQPKIARNESAKDFRVASGTSGLPTFTTDDTSDSSVSSVPDVPSVSEPIAENEAETTNTPVVPQFEPNANPPALGELPSFETNTPTTKVPPSLSRQVDKPSGGVSLVVPPPENSPSPNGAGLLVPPPNPVPSITSTTPNPNGSSVNNDLAAVRSLDSIQASEVKRYFEGQWKPIKEVKQSLDYTLAIDPNGSVARIIPMTEASRQYIDRTGMPKLTNTPMVSPVGGSRGVKIRVSLEPDGTVKTFQEQ